MAKFVNSMDIVVRHNYMVEISNYFSSSYFEYLKKYTRKNIVDLRNIPPNIEVQLISMLYFVPDGRNKFLGNRMARKVEKFLMKKKSKFDLIHAHFTWPCGYAGLVLKKRFECPLVVTIHENQNWLIREFDSKNKKTYEVWKNADALIRVNKRDVPLLSQFNSNIYSIPNGFNYNRIKIIAKDDARQIIGLDRSLKLLFSLGFLIPRKGFHFLIDSIGRILKNDKDIKCVIGGSGPFAKELQKRIRELGLQDHVTLLGFIDDEELHLWMNACDLFVIPSLSEGNPTVMFEALGCGKPVVATRVGGIPEIITSEDYGLLCNPGDPKDLAEKILIALDKKWDHEKIRKYAEQFTWDNIAKQVMAVYEEVLRK